MDYESLAIVFGPIIVDLSSICVDNLHIETEIIFKVSFRISFKNKINC